MALILIILVGCAQAAPETGAPPAEALDRTTEAEKPAEPQPTQAPLPTATAPSGAVQPSPTPWVEQRLVELEWPPRLRLGDSDVVRLTLVPSDEGYLVTTEYPEHRTDTQTVYVERPGGYDLYALARLDGVGFTIAPAGEQERYLPPGEAVTWYWSLAPNAQGQQRLTVSVVLRWMPQAGSGGILHEAMAYTHSLDMQITSFFGMTRGQAMTGGLIGLIIGGSLCVLAVVELSRPRGVTVQTQDANLALVIEARPGLTTSPEEKELLQTLFRRYARLALESEFLSGYSGARAFLAQPVRQDGGADAYTIVKIGQKETIRREYENYETYVKDTLPPMTARIQHAPVTVRRGTKAALQYTFIAEPGRLPVSLRQALLENPDPGLLEKLFATFGPNWWMQRRPYTFRLGQEYDRVLPVHYVIEPDSRRGAALDGRTTPAEASFRVGEQVILHNFTQVERRGDGRSLSLRGEAMPGQPPLRVRWLSLADPNGAYGRVTATRGSILSDLTMGFERFDLPDPLERLNELLNRRVNGSQSILHGDLNLENALVGPGGLVWLIDFATTRAGHALFDFAHLEAEVIAHVIAARAGSAEAYLRALQGQPSEALQAFICLRGALHEIAERCLFNPSQPGEYHLAAMMTCLGALKYANLEPLQRQLLYLTAAHLSKNT